MTRLCTSPRRFLLAVAVLAMPLAPGCSCGVLASLTELNRAPPSPVVAALPAVTTVAALTISGTTVPLTSVTAQLVEGGTTQLRALEDAEPFAGRVTLVEGNNTIFVAATNGAAVTSQPAGPFVVVLDTVAPQAPNVVEPAAPLVAGSVPLETTVAVEAADDCLLDISVGGVAVADTDVVADDQGFIVSVSLVAGDNAVEASCRDVAGNRSPADLATIAVVVDDTAPLPPTFEPPVTPLVFEAPAVTARLNLRGTRPEGTRLVVDGVEVPTAATTWEIVRDLGEDDHELVLQTEGGNGVRSEPVTVTVAVRLRPQPPLPDPPPGLTNATPLSLTGTRCVTGHKIYAATSENGAGEELLAGTCTAFQDIGRFSTSVSLSSGNNSVYLYTERDLGVQSRRVGPLQITLDVEPPPAPTITFPSCASAAPRNCNAIVGPGEPNGVFELSGTRDAADAITVNSTTIAAGDTLWAETVTVAATGTTTVTVRAVDPAGNASEPVVVNVTAVAGLSPPALQCIGPYRFTGSNPLCPVLTAGLPASRRALRGPGITVRGRAAAAGQRVRVCSVPAAAGAVDNPCGAVPGGQVVDVTPQADRTFVAELDAALPAGTNIFLQAHTGVADGAVSAFVGPNVVRRDDQAPAAPSALVVADVGGTLTGTPPTTNRLDIVVSGAKSFDGDVCLRQVAVTEQTCPAGNCPAQAFSPCLVLAAADGLVSWRGDVRLLGGLNRLCVESSDVVPRNGEAPNPNAAAGERQFEGNVSADVCVDVALSVDPVPEFVQPVADALVRPGRLVAQVALQDAAELTTGVDVCVGAVTPCVTATEDVLNGLWTAEVQLPAGDLGDSVVLRADARVGAAVRGSTSITVRLVPGGQLVSDSGPIVAADGMVGRISPRVAGGTAGELLSTWEDDCFLRSSPACTIRNTVGALQNTPPPSVFLRRLVAGSWQRLVNVSDDPRVGGSSEPVIAVDGSGITHIAWIDIGFDDPQGTLVHRTLEPDLTRLQFGPTVIVSADFENANGLKELDFRPSMVSGAGGETVVAWVKQRDAVEGSEGTRYVAFAVYCSLECSGYESEASRTAGVWSAAVQISPFGNTPLDYPAVAVDPEALPTRRAWVAWNLNNNGTRLLQLRDVALDPAVALPAVVPLTVPASGVTAASRPMVAMDPSGLLHVVWNAADGVRGLSVDTIADPPEFSPERLLVPHEAAADAVAADLVAPTAGQATVVVSMVSTEEFCFAEPPASGTLRLVEVGESVDVTALVSGGLTSSPRLATLAGGSTAVIYEEDACAANGDAAVNAFLEVVPR